MKQPKENTVAFYKMYGNKKPNRKSLTKPISNAMFEADIFIYYKITRN